MSDKKSSITNIVDRARGLNPDVVDVTIVPGDNVKFDITATVPRRSTRSQLDLVFLSDLSGSFRDDLPVLRDLIPDLVSEVRDIQPDSQFGLASFIDKPQYPLGDFGDYVYRTEQAVTDSLPDFQTAMNGLKIGNGMDLPEAQLEGLMQVALREKEVGYRNNSRRVVVLSTDADYHQAGDGKSAGIITANNGDIVLDGDPAGTGEDYPGINQVKAALQEAGIVPIFAVTGDQTRTYEQLVDELGFGTVETLSRDSSNLVEVVTSGLEKVLSDLTMVAQSDEFGYVQSINPVQYTDVKGGESRTFEVELGTTDLTTRKDSLSLEVLGYGETTVNVKPLDLPDRVVEDEINIGDLSKGKTKYRNTDEIGFIEGGYRDLQDLYKFTLSAECEVNLTLDQLKRNADVEILDADGSTVLFNSTEANRRREEITENLESGTYYIRVYPEGSDRTRYRLAVSAEALTDEIDSTATAKDLGVIGSEEVSEINEIGFGRGKNRDEQDYFKFSVAGKSEFFLTLDQLKGNADVEILDKDGETVLFQSFNDRRRAEKISEVFESGDYYVRVFPKGNARTDYRLGLSASPFIEYPDTPPGIFLGEVSEGNPVRASDDVGRATANSRNTVDWYSFTLSEESDVNLTLDRLRADLNVAIYDEDGEELVEEGNNKGRKAEKLELEGLEAGTYTVKVTPNGDARSNYRLGITAALPYVDDYPTPEEAYDFGAIADDEKKVFNNEMGRTEGRSGRDQEDWTRFELTEDGSVSIDLGRLRQNIDMILYEDDGTSVMNRANERGRKNENINTFLDAGTYYVKVLPKGNARSDYRLTVNTGDVDPVDEFEVGDLLSLDDGYSNNNRIGFTSSGIRNTIDRYIFTVGEESDVDITLSQLRGDANITLYESNGTLLRDSTNPGRQEDEISDTLEPGTYFLEVEPQGTAKTPYLLDIFASSDAADTDGGPIPGSSLYTDIGELAEDYSKIDTVGFGNGSSRDQVDYYGFSLSEEKRVSISLENLSANINLELRDSSDSVLYSSRNGGKADENIEEDLERGTYYIRVEPQGSARGNYTLKVGGGMEELTDPDGGRPPENVNDIGVLGDYSDSDSIGFRESGYRDVNDYRKFTLTKESTVDINLTNLKANADLELIDSDGRTLLQRSAKGGSLNENINETLNGGDYYLRVLPKGAAKTSYDLNMSAGAITEVADDTAPGIDLGTAGDDPLTKGGLIGFTEGGKVDTHDYYNFVLDTGGFVNITLDGLSGNANLELYDSKGRELLGSSTNSGTSSEEIQTFLSPDTYVVKVLGQGSQTPYDLSVSA
ncbi:pre-peptidase C-terminal domain-containing protein [Lyngbya sp. CCY1209]|uniref:pre-peptidase C-terminal domain-containing protein n=1 Tax=Lyngbya sp. CCY1209 TaxID=2886103 RepID=UPI002D1FD454|nr:pre-peptidase C-terminal domain-containing protein [Lyngbya sp. CCY1209]MEB3885594.1 pre-peptidase C-terminal domain-containing protein [Lyngbya sp. CCY1209]